MLRSIVTAAPASVARRLSIAGRSAASLKRTRSFRAGCCAALAAIAAFGRTIIVSFTSAQSTARSVRSRAAIPCNTARSGVPWIARSMAPVRVTAATLTVAPATASIRARAAAGRLPCGAVAGLSMTRSVGVDFADSANDGAVTTTTRPATSAVVILRTQLWARVRLELRDMRPPLRRKRCVDNVQSLDRKQVRDQRTADAVSRSPVARSWPCPSLIGTAKAP